METRREGPRIRSLEVVVVVNANAVEDETDLTEPRDKTPYLSTPPPLASTLVSGILGLAWPIHSVSEHALLDIMHAACPTHGTRTARQYPLAC
jgi:hypothetical protein